VGEGISKTSKGGSQKKIRREIYSKIIRSQKKGY
jgi:hypothetical protein